MNEKPIPGTRVMLNPDSPAYSSALDYTNGETNGYIVDPLLDDVDIKQWNYESNHDRLKVKIRFDNKAYRNIYMRDIVTIDSPVKNVTKYNTHSDKIHSDKIYHIKSVNEDEIDEKIIEKGYKIMSIKNFDEKWREKVI